MDEDFVLNDDVTRYGLRRIHVMRMGEPVTVEKWIQRVPQAAIHTCSQYVWVEKEMGMHHLLLCWKVREAVNIVDPLAKDKTTSVVMWWVDVKNGDTIRKAADDAACLFSLLYPWLPTKAALRTLPKAALNQTLDEPFEKVAFIQEYWVPKNCVAVW